VADAEQRQPDAGTEMLSATALPAPVLWCGRMAVAFGSLVLVLLVRLVVVAICAVRYTALGLPMGAVLLPVRLGCSYDEPS
jgi:hypothetical protein